MSEIETLPARISKVEMNTVEFPIATLAHYAPEDLKAIEFSDEVEHPQKPGRMIRRKWRVAGDPERGLPIAGDFDMYIMLLEIWREQGQDSPKVFFSRNDLARRLKASNNDIFYKRIRESLERLVGVTITAENAFYDPRSRSYVSKGFHILSGYELHDERYATYTNTGDKQKYSYVLWDETLFASMKDAGNLMTIDVNRYLSLNSALSRQLYLYLTKKGWVSTRKGRPVYEERIERLAHEHIGVSRSKRYNSQLKQALTPSLQELTKNGVLVSFTFRKTSDGKGEKVVCQFPLPDEISKQDEVKAVQKAVTETLRQPEYKPLTTPETNYAPVAKTDLAELCSSSREGVVFAALVKNKIKPVDARRLAIEHTSEAERQLTYLPYQKDDSLTNIGGWLRKAIENKYDPPAAYLSKVEKDQQNKKDAERREKAMNAAALKKEQEESESQQVNHYLESLEAKDLEDLVAKVKREMPVFLRERNFAVHAAIRTEVRKRLNLTY